MILYALIFTLSLLTAFLLTPTIRSIALRFYIIDRKDQRKIHNKVVSKLGGLALFAGFIFSSLSAFLLEYVALKPFVGFYGAILIGTTIILCLGVYDDVRGANAQVKIVAQILASLVMVKYGIIIKSIATPFGTIVLGEWSILTTILFLVLVTNAINLIDGMDGLAAGVVLIISLGIFARTLIEGGSPFTLCLAVALAGACLGFLHYNFHPAKIFMGDTGSLFLGFALGAIIVEASLERPLTPHPQSFFVSLVALTFPLLDTTFVFFRRLWKRTHPFRADKSHIHHQLSKRGFSQQKVVLFLYVVTLIFVLISLTL